MAEDRRRLVRAWYDELFPDVYRKLAQVRAGAALDLAVRGIFAKVVGDEDHGEDAEAWRGRVLHLTEEQLAERNGGGAAANESAAACIRPATAGRVEAYFAGRVAPSAESGLREHLEQCPACRREYLRLWEQEGDALDAMARRRTRLARGLPWPEADPAGGPTPEPAPEPADPPAEDEAAVDPTDEEPQEPRAPSAAWNRGVMIAGGVLAIVAAALLLIEPRSEKRRVEKPPRDPDRGLVVHAFRRPPAAAGEEILWELAMGSVASGDKMILSFSPPRGDDERRHLAAFSLDDGGRLHWFFPAPGEPEAETRLYPERRDRPIRLERAFQVPANAKKIVVYVLLSRSPVRLADLARQAHHLRGRRDFFARPPRLAVPQSAQRSLVLDVIP